MDINGIKRLLTFVVGFLAVVLNKKLGLELDAAAQATIVALCLGFIGQSMYKEKSLALLSAESKTEVPTTDKAVEVFNTIKGLMILALVGTMLLPTPARAGDLQSVVPADAPVVASTLKAGEPAPEAGCFLPNALCTSVAQKLVVQEKTIAQLKSRPEWWVVGVALATGVVVGAGAVAYLVHR